MRFIVAVAEERNFTRAAARCHISQPALSRQVAEVEQLLGAKLFERQSRHVEITRTGGIFAREARRALEQSKRAIGLVQSAIKQDEQPLRLGISLLADIPKQQGLLDRARKSSRQVTFTNRAAYTQQLVRDLLRGDLDLAIVDLPMHERGLRQHLISSECLIAAFPEKFRVPKQPSLRFRNILGAPLTLISKTIDPARPLIEQALASAGSRSFKPTEAESLQELLDAVPLEGRIGLVRESAMRFQRHGVVYRQISDSVQLTSALAWRADDRRPKLQSFRDALITFANQK